MVANFRVGRLFGFDINVHWSWLFIFFLVTATFATSLLVDIYPEWAPERRWVVAVSIAAIFFLSILFHELSHSLVARHYGIPVSSITLFVFGGVSNLEKEPEDANEEFLIAIVGPLTSLLIAGLFGLAYYFGRGSIAGLDAVAAYLAMINLSIAVFNLIPGFPLDGGRVLRSVFWSQRHNQLDATRTASNLGQLVAYVIMAAGVIGFLLGDFISGIWLFLIGNFLRSASAASYEELFMRTVLKGVPASAVARIDFTAVAPDTLLLTLVEEHILAGDGRCYPVVAGDQLLGLVTLTDLRKFPREQWPATTVFRAMTPFDKLRTVSLRDDLPQVLVEMARGDINQVPLLEGKTVRGLIYRGDVMRYIQVRQELGTVTGSV